MKRGAFSSSPRVSTFLHEVINQGAEVRYLKGNTNVSADQASRSPAPCDKPDRCQICIWINDKEEQVVRRLIPSEVEKIISGKSPMPYTSRNYWRKRQLEDHTLKQVAHHLKHGSTPPKSHSYQRVRRYLQTQHGLYLSSDNVLLAPSIKEFSTTPRFVVPEASTSTLVSIFHHQFGCLAQTPLKDILRRHFFVLDLDAAVNQYVSACLSCAATRNKTHIDHPMSSVEPPRYFGDSFAADVIEREKQRILVLRETATSYTWATLVKSQRAAALEDAFRQLFMQVRAPNAARPSVCRIDNHPSLISLAENGKLSDLGITLDPKNKANQNGNPVAEKANQELHKAIVTVLPSGGKLNTTTLAKAVSQLNAKPRWSSMSAVELWTGRSMLDGETLIFNQEDIIAAQHENRQKTHPTNATPLPIFHPGEIVFCNNERSKLRARDRLVVRERLQNGMYRLDRLKNDSGRITRAFLPARELYRYTAQERKQGPQESDCPEQNSSEGTTEDDPTPVITFPPEEPQTKQDILPLQPTTLPQRPKVTNKDDHVEESRPVPPAPGMASEFNPIGKFVPFHFPTDAFGSAPLFTPSLQDRSEQVLNVQPTQQEDGSDQDVFDSAESGDDLEPTEHRETASSPSDRESPEDVSGPQDDREKSGEDHRTQKAVPIQRQRSGSYPPPPRRPGNTNDWSRRDHSVLRNLDQGGRPQRQCKPPTQLTYDENGKQILVRTKRTDL